MELRNNSDTPFWFFKFFWLDLSLSHSHTHSISHSDTRTRTHTHTLSNTLTGFVSVSNSLSPSHKMTWLSSFHLLAQKLQSQFSLASFFAEISIKASFSSPHFYCNLFPFNPLPPMFSFSFTSRKFFSRMQQLKKKKKQEDTKMFPSRDIFFFFLFVLASINKPETSSFLSNLVQRWRELRCSTTKLISNGFGFQLDDQFPFIGRDWIAILCIKTAPLNI